MPTQAWSQGVVSQQASGTLFNTYTAAKTVINQQALLPIGGNQLKVGDVFEIDVLGGISNIVTTPGTITLEVHMGTIAVWTSGAIQLNATAHTTLPFKLHVDLTCQVINSTVGGAVAKFMGQGVLTGVMFTKTAAQVDGVNSETVINVPVTAPAQGTAFDSTISQTLDFWAAFSISNAGNGIQIHQYIVNWLN